MPSLVLVDASLASLRILGVEAKNDFNDHRAVIRGEIGLAY